MANKLNDLANGFLVTCGLTVPVAGITTTGITGPALNFVQGDGNCFAIQNIGTIIGVTGTISGKIQESPTTTAASFTDISGATFPGVVTVATTGPNVQVITFQRSQPFLRYVGVVAGVTIAVTGDVTLIEQLKQF